MAVIYDENVVKYKFSGGLWNVDIASGAFVPPNDEFLATLINGYVKADGSIARRPGISTAVTLTAPASSKNVALHYPVGAFSSTALCKGMIFDAEYNSAGIRRMVIVPHINSGYANAFSTVGIADISAYVEYLSTIYYSSTNLGVNKITSITWPGGGFISSSIVGSPNLDGMIFFKGRLFGFKNSTIYFTEAVVGSGLPETWNTTTNTIIVNSSGSTPKIYKMMVFNDKIMIFTDNGLFALSVAGAPSSWVLKPTDLGVSVNAFDCAVEFRGYIYFVDKTGVWASNGASSTLISEPVGGRFINAIIGSSFRIYKVGNFLFVSMFINNNTGTYVKECYYSSFENLGSWAEFQSMDSTVFPGIPVGALSGSPLFDTARPQDAVLLCGTSTGNLASKMVGWNPNSPLDNATNVTVTIRSGSLSLGNDHEVKYVKHGFIAWKQGPNTGSVSMNVSPSIGVDVQTITNTWTGFEDLNRFSVGTRLRELKFLLTYTDASTIGGILDYVGFVIGTERKVTEAVER